MSKQLFAIYAEDKPNSLTKRLAVRPKHLQRLQALSEANQLILAGPFPISDDTDASPQGFSGSLIVAQFNSLAEAQDWANDDPYIEAGVYDKVTVKPFIQVLPNASE